MYLVGETQDTSFIEHQIRSLGFDVLLAHNQNEALASAKYWKPAAIISEISPHNLKGFELFRLLKEDARTNSIPFLFLSDRKVKPDQVLGFQLGADDYLTRPWEPNEFRSRLISLLRNSAPRPSEGAGGTAQSRRSNGARPRLLFHEPASVEESSERENFVAISQEEDVREENAKVEQPLSENVAKRTPAYDEGKALYKRLIRDLGEIYDEAEKEHTVDLIKLAEISELLVNQLNQNNKLLLQALYQKTQNSVVNDSVNTAVYAVLIGKGLGYGQGKLIDLGVAALVHDIGFVKLPGVCRKPKYDLSDKDIDKIQMHPVYGAEIIKSSLEKDIVSQYSWLPTVVLQVHEREGGIGYPHGLRGDEIHEMAKIIGIADTFEALLWEHTNKKVPVTYQALQKIVGMDKRYFSPKLKKALITQISIFPLGTYVKLNSGEIGVVVETNKSHPTRPVVDLLFDAQGVPLANPARKNLLELPFLFITEVMAPDEVYRKQQDRKFIV